MQEEIQRKCVVLVIQSTKLTGRVLQCAIQAYLKHRNAPDRYRGKLSLKALSANGTNIKKIDLADQDIKAFEKIARKWRVTYCPTRDTNSEPPRYYIWFKADREELLTAAFQEFVARKLQQQDKSSILAKLHKEISRSFTRNLSRVKNRELER